MITFSGSQYQLHGGPCSQRPPFFIFILYLHLELCVFFKSARLQISILSLASSTVYYQYLYYQHFVFSLSQLYKSTISAMARLRFNAPPFPFCSPVLEPDLHLKHFKHFQIFRYLIFFVIQNISDIYSPVLEPDLHLKHVFFVGECGGKLSLFDTTWSYLYMSSFFIIYFKWPLEMYAFTLNLPRSWTTPMWQTV